MQDNWSDGEAYERFIGRWSREIAPLFLDWLDQHAGLRWVDLGCGSGALTTTILERAAPSEVLGVDPSAAFCAVAGARVRDERARFQVGRATDLVQGSADVVVSGLVLNFVEDPQQALAAMSAAAPGGTVAAYVWDYAGGMQMLTAFWEVVGLLDPASERLDEAARFPLCHPGPLEELWHGTGLSDVAVTKLEIETTFADFDDFWQPFLGGQGAAPTYLATLGEDVRAEVREALRARLDPGTGAPLELTARAWAVRGLAP